jgi:hypothetical protein
MAKHRVTVVYIVIEWTGNSDEIDGANILGVFSDRGKAEALAKLGRWREVQEHPVQP